MSFSPWPSSSIDGGEERIKGEKRGEDRRGERRRGGE